MQEVNMKVQSMLFGPVSKDLFVCVEVNVQVNEFSFTSGRSHRFLGITSIFGE